VSPSIGRRKAIVIVCRNDIAVALSSYIFQEPILEIGWCHECANKIGWCHECANISVVRQDQPCRIG